MGILSDEQYDEMVKRMEAAASDTPEVVAQSDEAPQSEDSEDVKGVEDGSSSDTEDVNKEVETQVASSESDEAPKTPEHIPYSRFKEVNDKFRAREAELQQAMERVQALEQLTLQQAQPQPAPEKSADDTWLEELFGEEAEDPSAQALKQIRQEMHSLTEWQQQRTEQLVGAQLKAEIEMALEGKPDVREAELWQAVAADGSVDVEQAAEYIQKHRNDMREQYRSESSKEIEVLKAKIAEMEKVSKDDTAFRRPSSTSAAPPRSEAKHNTVAQATEAFAEALREQMSH